MNRDLAVIEAEALEGKVLGDTAGSNGPCPVTRIGNLLLAERNHHVRWWTVLNEMRLNCETPQRLLSKSAGTAADWELYVKAQGATSLAVLDTVIVLPGDVLAFVAGDRQALIDLIEDERTFAIGWWEILNDLRRRGELPDWAIRMSVGHEPDIDRWREKAGAVNSELFNTEYVRELTTSARAAAPWLKEMLT